MKTQIFITFVLLTVGAFTMASEKSVTKQTVSSAAKLGTSFRFNPNAFHGKRQVSPNLTATVENDKYLDDLLAPRKSFNDRIEQDQQRN